MLHCCHSAGRGHYKHYLLHRHRRCVNIHTNAHSQAQSHGPKSLSCTCTPYTPGRKIRGREDFIVKSRFTCGVRARRQRNFMSGKTPPGALFCDGVSGWKKKHRKKQEASDKQGFFKRNMCMLTVCLLHAWCRRELN